MKKIENNSDKRIVDNKEDELSEDYSVRTAEKFIESKTLMLNNHLQSCNKDLEMKNEELLRASKQGEKVSEEVYAEFYNLSTTGFFLLNSTGEIVEANFAGSQIFGKELSLLKNNMFELYISNDSKPIFKLFFNNVFKHKDIESCELSLLTSNNMNRSIYLTGTVSMDEEHCLLNIYDITAGKQKELELIERENRYKRITENISDYLFTVIVKDGKAIETIHSRACEIVTGYTPEEFEADSFLWIKMVVPEEREWVAGRLKKILRGENLPPFEHRIICKNGEIRWINDASIPKYDSKGKLVYYDGVIKDITHRKNIELALKKSENLLCKAMEIAKFCIWKYDVDNRQYILNDQFYHLFKTSIDQEGSYIISSDAFNNRFICQGDLSIFLEKLQKAMETNDPKFQAHYYHHISHTNLPPTFLCIHLHVETNEQGRVIWVHGVNQDISELKEAEEKLRSQNAEIERQNNEYHVLNKEYLNVINELKQLNTELVLASSKAEESNKLKTAFLQNISHEIRTPLNGIVGFSSMFVINDLSQEKRKKFANLLCSCSDQLLAIITDIISMATIESGQEIINVKEVNINNLLIRIENQFKYITESKGNSLSISTNLNLNSSNIVTDEVKLIQIITNLLNNANKFTHNGKINLNCSLKKEFIQFSVEDNGIGIPADKYKLIFKRFSQASDDITINYGGTGLGLSISKAYVHLLGGKIWLKSQPNEGSTFYFTILAIPIHPDNKQKEKSNTLNYIRKSDLTIVIAEDNIVNYLILEEYLSELNCTIIHSKNGIQAVEACKNNPSVALVIMDIKMPLMNGLEAAQKIREIMPDVPIIFQTAFIYENKMEKTKLAFCDDYIEKPIKKEELLNLISLHLKTEIVPRDSALPSNINPPAKIL